MTGDAKALLGALTFAVWPPFAAQAQMPGAIDPVHVQTAAGTLQGSRENTVIVFRGVPYAAAPVGESRWRSPQPVKPWQGVRAATAHEPACTQPVDLDTTVANFGGVNGAQSEDCLYLTITAPEGAADAPVLVWFHGGAFFLGAGSLGSYDGTANARQGVITVSVNYRLGAMANLVHPALESDSLDQPQGNYALQDSVAVLEWVRDNIANFGGDSGAVTVAGQSAGGGIVTNLLSLPSAQGLFHKAIVQSGSLLLPDRPKADAEKMAIEALSTIGVDGGATADGLRSISSQTFAASEALRAGFFFNHDQAFKPVSTIDALKAGTEVDVPLLVGSNKGEGGFRAARTFAGLAGDEGAPAFLYRFDHTPALRAAEWRSGPIHSAELMFTFDSIDQSSFGGPKADSDDRDLAEKVNGCWVAFVKMPANARNFECAGGFDWQPYKPGGSAVLIEANGLRAVPADAMPDGPEKTAS
ncbi:carboxylesterase/lipase family protein [Erythrobacter sp. QSSC1-22B]|uniref:carboxylesterase/lipase family protein n=1 Tax=Erythrobacter sp. QSSC1-22B TaxID=1860125 RepID=UPI000A850AFB|nr:carboxylesterase family protein [Erythrobacter sp. QSSC1-22B]